jgi:hypothetical protein
MLGQDKTKSIKDNDFVVCTVVLYNTDANQDWVHSFLSLRACIQLFLDKCPHIKTLRVRSDVDCNFKCASCVLGMILMTSWTHNCGLELMISEAGGGKDLTDSLIQKQKQLLAEIVEKKGGSVKSAAEAVKSVL